MIELLIALILLCGGIAVGAHLERVIPWISINSVILWIRIAHAYWRFVGRCLWCGSKRTSGSLLCSSCKDTLRAGNEARATWGDPPRPEDPRLM